MDARARAREDQDLEALRRGDIAALMRRHGRLVTGRVAMRVRDPSLRDDIAQEAWLRVYRLRDEFRGDCAVSTWLVAIVDQMARTKLRDECRRVARDERLRDPVEYADPPDEIADRRRTVRRLRSTLAAMPPIKRATIILRAVDEAALTEVAALTGQPVGTVKSSTFYGLRLVRKCLS